MYRYAEGFPSIYLGNTEILLFFYFTVDLISIDRRSRDREAECLERASVLAKQFLESVQDTADYVWKPADRSPPEPHRCVFDYHSWGLNTLTQQTFRIAFRPLGTHISPHLI